MNDKVLISVLLPVYNGEKYVSVCLDSILNQTFDNYEIVAIDDGSSDATWQILQEYAKEDSRIRVTQNTKNLGLIKTLNKGIELCRGRYIARADADDISLNNRLEVQYNFMVSNPEIDVISSFVDHIDRDGVLLDVKSVSFGASRSYQKCISPKVIKYVSFIYPQMIHPSVFGKREAFDLLYRDELAVKHIEDFELWLRLIDNGFKLSNVSNKLLQKRDHIENVGNKYGDIQSMNKYIVAHEYAEKIFLMKISAVHLGIALCNLPILGVGYGDYIEAVRLLDELLVISERKAQFSNSELVEFETVALRSKGRLLKNGISSRNWLIKIYSLYKSLLFMVGILVRSQGNKWR